MVSRCLHHCKTLFSGADFSEYQQKQKFQETEKKLSTLEKHSKEIFQELRRSIDAKEKELDQSLSNYLQSDSIRDEIYNFTDTEMQFVSNFIFNSLFLMFS